MTNRLAALDRRGVVTGAAATLAMMTGAARDAFGQGATATRIRIAFKDHVFSAALQDNATVRDLVAMLPLERTITDYSTNEKIAHLPRKLVGDGAEPFTGEAPGDVCYYAPWGNLAFFHAGYRFSRGLIRLGRLEGGIEPLLTRGDFPLRIERLA